MAQLQHAEHVRGLLDRAVWAARGEHQPPPVADQLHPADLREGPELRLLLVGEQIPSRHPAPSLRRSSTTDRTLSSSHPLAPPGSFTGLALVLGWKLRPGQDSPEFSETEGSSG